MSNHLKVKPAGVDYYIQQLQILAYNTLIASWGAEGLTANQFEVFGRAYRNAKRDTNGNLDGYIPEVFTQGVDYREALFDDRIAALMWFAVNDPETVTANQTHGYKVSLYGFVNLNLIRPDDNGQRVDMEVVNEVVNLIDRKYGFSVTAIYRNIDKILEYYSGSRTKKGVTQFNMQPNMSFRIDMEIVVNIALLTFCGNGLNLPVYYNGMNCTFVVEFHDTPDISVLQPLCNGRTAQLQYPTGATVIIPHMIGRYVTKVQVLDGENVVCVRNVSTGTFNYPGDGQFAEGSIMYIDYNEN